MTRRPVVLLIHGGGFVEGDTIGADAERAARVARARPVEVHYPLGDIGAAMTYCATLATRYGQTSDVVAYGESAGACLAVRLAQQRLVRRAVGLFTVPDLVHMGSLNLTVVDMIESAGDVAARTDASPALNTTFRPVLAQMGDSDALIPNSVTRAWANSDRAIGLQTIRCRPNFGHGTPIDRSSQLASAMAFLFPLSRGRAPSVPGLS